MPDLTDLIPGVSQAKLILAGVGLALFVTPTVGLLITRHTLADVRTKDGKAIDGLTSQRDSWKDAFDESDTNFHTAIDIANRESASIMALKMDGEQRARNAKAQLAEALKANAALTEQGKALTTSAGRHYSDKEPCASSGAYMTAKDM